MIQIKDNRPDLLVCFFDLWLRFHNRFSFFRPRTTHQNTRKTFPVLCTRPLFPLIVLNEWNILINEKP